MKILKPRRMSLESFESSNDSSVKGFLGKSHAVCIVARDDINGCLKLFGRDIQAAQFSTCEQDVVSA